jgi:serine/threonine-protein kinase
MPFTVPLADAISAFPEYKFVRALTPSAQKAAFHVQDQDENHLCLKIISPDYERDRLDREILALQRLDHPNVARLREYTFSSKPNQQRHYMVEEFVDGVDLSQELQLPNRWPAKRAADFFAMLCDGLAALESQSIVHRDIKPANIRVRPDGSPVIIDFGLARHLNLPALTKTAHGAQIGTPMYFAPEQFDGTHKDIDHRTDLFAVGILLYEALTGERPFYKDNITWLELRNAVCDSNGHLVRAVFVGLDSKLKILITKLLDKERANRPVSAAQVAGILRKIGGLL